MRHKLFQSQIILESNSFRPKFFQIKIFMLRQIEIKYLVRSKYFLSVLFQLTFQCSFECSFESIKILKNWKNLSLDQMYKMYYASTIILEQKEPYHFRHILKKYPSLPKKPGPNTDVQDKNMGEKGRGCECWQLACSKISGEM